MPVRSALQADLYYDTLVKQKIKEALKHDLVRWTFPPGVSIVIHAGLIGAVAYIGTQISALNTDNVQLPIAEFELPPPPDLPEQQAQESELQNRPENLNPKPQRSFDPSITQQVSSLDAAAAKLQPLRFTAPAMDQVALEAMQTTNAQIANPQSASPPTVNFAGVQSKAARKIVYVVDGSGATANSFSYLQTQLMSSIDRLSPTQQFQVVLFRSSNDQTLEVSPIGEGRLARATMTNKHLVSQWLETTSSRGRSNPVDGLKHALSFKPDLVLLITRSIQRTEMGWAQGQRAILDELNTLNPQNPVSGKRQTVIKTIQLLDEDPTGIMQAIGIKHGDGTDDYRVITYDSLIANDLDDEGIDDLRTRSIGASNEQRITTAGELMNTLASSGASLAAMYSFADSEQRAEVLLKARQIRSLITQLAQADGRAAMLDAQTTLLIHSIDPSQVDQQQLTSIVSALDDVMYTEPNTDAQRAMLVAIAYNLLGEPDIARDRIRELFELADDLELDQTTLAQATLAMISIQGESQGFDQLINDRLNRAPFVTSTGGIDAVWGVIAREALTRSRLALYARDDSTDLDWAWAPMTSLRAGAGSNRSIRNYIDTRITLMLQESGPTRINTQLPNPVLLAATNTLSHSKEHREQAMDLLEEIALREEHSLDGNPKQLADTLWQIGVLGRAINTKESITRSSAALTKLASQFPTHPNASDAISGAILATPAQDLPLKRERLELAISLYPDHPQIDLWRLDLSELLSGFARLDVLDPITPNTREGVLAGELYERTVQSMLDQYTDPQIRQGLGIRMRDAAIRFEIQGVSMWTKRAAINEIELDPQSAIRTIDQLITEARSQNQSTDELELMRAQTLSRLGQTRTAFDALSELSARIDASGNRTSTYWQAWALMLESIVELGTKTEKADALRHITRLELIDQNLGGSPWRQRITDARQTLHSSS